MKLRTFSPPFAAGDYRVYFRSADGFWSIGTKPVIFGMRVVAWRDRSAGPTVDYCAGDNPPFLSELLITVATIFSRHLPDGAAERQVLNLMPTWQRRPIDGDPCWPALQALAATPGDAA